MIEFTTATIGSSPRGERDRQPLIGLGVNVDEGSSRLHEAYIQAVLDAGGVPLPIPATTDADALRRTVEILDGVVLTGGGDIAGDYFSERTLDGITPDPLRDEYDFLLLRLAADRCLPVLGICRGMQVINVAFGGTLWQDIPSRLPRAGEHSLRPTPAERWRPAHEVDIMPGTLLSEIFGACRTKVNSRHHQAVRDIAPGFRAAAIATDGVVEAIEGFPARRVWGVQWHPENMATGGDANSSERVAARALFESFVRQASLFRAAKTVHAANPIVDSHADTAMLFSPRDYEPELTAIMRGAEPLDFGRRHSFARVDFPKMAEGRVDAVAQVAYIPQGATDEGTLAAVWDETLHILGEIRRRTEACGRFAGVARRADEVEVLKASARRAVMLAVENGYAIGRDIENLRILKDLGVIYITLCHNGANDLCDSAAGEARHGGLSRLGRQAVREMNRLGIAVDLSHAAESTFHDVMRHSSAPAICSHSSARALCDHPRNLTDEQIRAIASSGGVVQVCLYSGFLVKGSAQWSGATVMDAVNHIDHMVGLVGDDHVGVGSDFDGGGGVPGCEGANELINITVELLRRGYPPLSVAKIMGGNFLRVIDQVQALTVNR